MCWDKAFTFKKWRLLIFMACNHENTAMTCDGNVDTTYCLDCDVDLYSENCPEVNTWPSEPQD